LAFSMTDIHFACDWIFEANGFRTNVNRLIDAAEALNSPLRTVNVTTPEGYFALRFVISVSSHATLDEFIEKAAAELGLINWVEVSQQYYSKISQFKGARIPTLQETGITDVVDSRARPIIGNVNNRLRELLATVEPIYLACEWLVTSPLSRTWLQELISTFGAFDIGREIRKGEVHQTREGYYIQQFVIRLFAEEELSKFVQHRGKEAGLTNWFAVSEQAFRQSTPFTISLVNPSIEGYQLELEKLGQANQELRKRLES
jgi:hypothetical protein